MGQEIEEIPKGDLTRPEFQRRLKHETLILKRIFEENAFEKIVRPMVGFELEGWLIDNEFLPLPINDEFLQVANSALFIREASQFNFEINVPPIFYEKNLLRKMEENFSSLWNYCKVTAGKLNADVMMIGIHPMAREDMLRPKYMSSGNRFRALEEQFFHLRKGRPLLVHIEGRDTLDLIQYHTMLEAAATSLQIHLQVNLEDSVRVFNSSMILSAPLVAIAANSPFLYGKELWDETRIAAFEQSLYLESFRDRRGTTIGRVTFGADYIKESVLEFFYENLNLHPALLPILFEDPPQFLSHLRLQNGTIWRWNRPVIGDTENAAPHLRIEQRVMSAGPTIADIVANTAFYLGAVEHFSTQTVPPEELMSFEIARDNFYKAAQRGLQSRINWFNREVDMQTLVLEDLIPKAKAALIKKGIEKADVEYYLGDVLYHRVLKGQNGANWQRAFVNFNGRDFRALSEKYMENQISGRPVHLWTL